LREQIEDYCSSLFDDCEIFEQLPLTDWHPNYPDFKWASICLALQT
jgi:hypothetical protein